MTLLTSHIEVAIYCTAAQAERLQITMALFLDMEDVDLTVTDVETGKELPL